MTYMGNLKKGDRVRVTIEGAVRETYGNYGARINNAFGERLAEAYTNRAGVTVEKLEPPVEVFKPGDRLRRKGLGNYEITLGDEGYLQHLASGRTVYAKYGADAPDFFNSENFEKLNIA